MFEGLLLFLEGQLFMKRHSTQAAPFGPLSPPSSPRCFSVHFEGDAAWGDVCVSLQEAVPVSVQVGSAVLLLCYLGGRVV